MILPVQKWEWFGYPDPIETAQGANIGASLLSAWEKSSNITPHVSDKFCWTLLWFIINKKIEHKIQNFSIEELKKYKNCKCFHYKYLFLFDCVYLQLVTVTGYCNCKISSFENGIDTWLMLIWWVCCNLVEMYIKRTNTKILRIQLWSNHRTQLREAFKKKIKRGDFFPPGGGVNPKSTLFCKKQTWS